MNGRPNLVQALDAIERGEADGLVVARLDRLSRSIHDFTAIVERARRAPWTLVLLDVNVDTSTAAGEALVNTLAVFAQFERRLIGERTREALAVKRAQGVRLGRPPSLDPQVRRRIRRLSAAGHSRAEIARRLNADDVATAQGGKRWYGSTVLAALKGSR